MKKALCVLTVALTLASGATTVLTAFSFYHHSALIGVIGGRSSGLVVVLTGLAQMYIAFNLAQYKRMAWWLAVVMGVVAFAVQHLQHSALAGQLMPLVLLAILGFTHGQYRVRSEPLLVVAGVRRAISIVALATLLGTLALWEVSPIHFGVDLRIWPAFTHSVEIVLFGHDTLQPLTRHAQQFLTTLHLLGILSYGFVLYSLFRPLYDRFVLTPHNAREVERLLRNYAESSEDIFKLWPADKAYFFAESHEGFVAYKVARGCAVALADPICMPHLRRAFAQEFAAYAAQHGWIPAFVQVSEQTQHVYAAAHYDIFKLGENAVVKLDDFMRHTARNKHFRNVANRFGKQGFAVEYHEAPHASALLDELRHVSDSWLTLPERRERSFGLGHFDEAYLQMSRLAVLRNRDGAAVAFANQQPNYSRTRASVDLMRHMADAPPNAMDFLFLELLRNAADAGWREFDLGLVPLAGVGQDKTSPLHEKLMGVFYHRGEGVFAFRGLYRFKNKFAPQWEASYLAYRSSQTALPRIALALAELMRGAKATKTRDR